MIFNILYKSKTTRRTGNALYDFIFLRLFSIQYGTRFDSSSDFPFPFHNMNTSTFQQNIGFYYDEIPNYPHDFVYYRNRKQYLIDLLNIEQVPFECDITIHLRLEDIFNDHPMYTLLPLSFYREVFSSFPFYSPICIIGKPINKEQVGIVREIEKLALLYFVDVRVRVIGRTIEDDFKTIMSSNILVGSTSSFWFWPAYLSNNVKEIHVPDFGQIQFMNLSSDDYVTIKKYKLKIKKKLTINEYLLF